MNVEAVLDPPPDICQRSPGLAESAHLRCTELTPDALPLKTLRRRGQQRVICRSRAFHPACEHNKSPGTLKFRTRLQHHLCSPVHSDGINAPDGNCSTTTLLMGHSILKPAAQQLLPLTCGRHVMERVPRVRIWDGCSSSPKARNKHEKQDQQHATSGPALVACQPGDQPAQTSRQQNPMRCLLSKSRSQQRDTHQSGG